MNTAITATTPTEYSYNDRYINRELSILDFHLRVLEQAVDPLHPLLERMNFLLIFSRNLDEFFEIRVAGVMEQFALGNESRSPDGLTPRQVLQKISETAHAAIERQYRILNEEILPKLREEDICFLRRGELTPAQSAWVKKYFQEQVAPVLTPISLDPAHPFPRLVNKSLNFIVTLEGKDAFGRQIDLAVVPAPRSLPRVVRLPDELTGGKEHHVMLSAIIHEHVSDLFPGMTATGCYQFRVTRNADLALNEDVEDLAKALKGELSSRRFGRAVRLEVTQNCPQHIYEYLLEEFDLNEEQLYKVDGPVTWLVWFRTLNALICVTIHTRQSYQKYLKRPRVFSRLCKSRIFYFITHLSLLHLLFSYSVKQHVIRKYSQLNRHFIVVAQTRKLFKF